MKFNIDHICGHDQMHQLFGKMADRLREEKRLAGRKCDACRKAERLSEAEAAVKASQEAGLPALTGTEKQTVWAETIRVSLMAEVHAEADANRDKLIRYGKDASSKSAGLAIVDEAVCAIAANAEAGWWIDRRGSTGKAIFAAAAKVIMAAKATV